MNEWTVLECLHTLVPLSDDERTAALLSLDDEIAKARATRYAALDKEIESERQLRTKGLQEAIDVQLANMKEQLKKQSDMFKVQMDAQNMTFEDGSFDFIISRNVTWTVPEPEKVYSEWFRLLSPGGVVINIDANYGYVFKKADESGWTEKQNAKWESSDQKLIGTRPDMVIERNDIAKNLSIASQERPQWDLSLMLHLGFREVSARANFMELLFPNAPKNAGSGEKPFEMDKDAPDTRIFMVKGVK